MDLDALAVRRACRDLRLVVLALRERLDHTEGGVQIIPEELDAVLRHLAQKVDASVVQRAPGFVECGSCVVASEDHEHYVGSF